MSTTHCEKHQFDRAADDCGRCGASFCRECLVYPFGERRPPFCIPCAIVFAGVRHGAGGRRRSAAA